MTLQRKLARAEAKLARRSAKLDRREEARLREVQQQLEQARIVGLEADLASGDLASTQRIWPKRRALLIINSKSGPGRDSLLRVRDIVALLERYNIQADVRVKLRKAQARREARKAAARGLPLVIAAGGDGTVEAVARGLVNTPTTLGILPLGTYNNVANSLGIPSDVADACALIANFEPRPIDVAQVMAVGMNKPRFFLETATVGLGAVLTSLGQDIEKGRLSEAARTLPMAMNMTPTSVVVRLDDARPQMWGNALLLTISNTPRAGAALNLAPEARVDDGFLDLVLYDGLSQADLAARILAIKNGTHTQDPGVRHARARSIDIHSAEPMGVAADSKLVGVTPARFSVCTGALTAIVGRGPGLSRPATGVVPLPELASAALQSPPPAALPTPAPATLASRANGKQPLELVRIATPVVAALVGAASVPVVRALAHRFERRR